MNEPAMKETVSSKSLTAEELKLAQLIVSSLNLDPAFLPRPLCFVESLPRNETGKLPRVAVEDLVARLAAKVA